MKMKRFGVVIAIVALVAAFAVIGCVSTGGGKGSNDERYTVDLSTLPAIRNTQPFAQIHDQLMIDLSGLPIDVSQFRRVTIRLRAFDARNNIITGWNANGVSRLILDTTGYTQGTNEARFKNLGGNVALMEVNTGFEGLGAISSNEGVLMGIRSKPAALGLLIENNSNEVRFIEITEITFHNGTAKAPEIRPIGDLGAFELLLRDNFQYGAGYQGQIRGFNLLGGARLAANETYTLKMTYTASRDLEQPLRFGFVDTSGNGWRPLSYRQPTGSEMPDVTVPASRANQEVTHTVTITLLLNAGGSSPAANTLIVETGGAGTRGRANSGERGAVSINFTEFVLTKVE